jgi:hypothetical protein
MSGVEDVEGQRRDYRAPHNARNPIPTISKYREEKQRRQDQYGHPEAADGEEKDPRNRRGKLGDAYNAFTGKGPDKIHDGEKPYEAENKNLVPASEETAEAADHAGQTATSKRMPRTRPRA